MSIEIIGAIGIGSKDLSDRQKEILNVFKERELKGELLPTTRDLKVALGYHSTDPVHRQLVILAKKGYLVKPEGERKARVWHLNPDIPFVYGWDFKDTHLKTDGD